MVEIKSNENGVISPEKVAEMMDEEVAAIMVTNPNTLGFIEDIWERSLRSSIAREGLSIVTGPISMP